jgi:hypothetical protein
VVYDKAANEIKNDTKMKEEAKNNEKETESVKEFSSAID